MKINQNNILPDKRLNQNFSIFVQIFLCITNILDVKK